MSEKNGTSFAADDLGRIAFGCSNLLGDKTREEGLRLLHAAYDCGIRRFDLARVYNFGDAETLFGQFQAGKRDSLTITTKFGLMPRENVARLKGPVEIARRVMRSSTAIRKLVRRNVRNLTQAGRFDTASAGKSLESSLRALRTDYIDIYLLHEAQAEDCTDELLRFLEKSTAEGKILSHGVGSAFAKVEYIAREWPAFLSIAQFESSLLKPNIRTFATIRPRETRLTITHGALAAAKSIQGRMIQDRSLGNTWSSQVGVDLTNSNVLHATLLRHALMHNSGGGIIFRASTPERIAANIKTLTECSLDSRQANALDEIGIALTA
jgi:aryl-alcohol dehydrogenase-like predicted oxidoreductase